VANQTKIDIMARTRTQEKGKNQTTVNHGNDLQTNHDGSVTQNRWLHSKSKKEAETSIKTSEIQQEGNAKAKYEREGKAH
jgi:hypothetical protein